MSKVILRNYIPSDYIKVKEILVEADLYVSTWDDEERLKNRIENKADSIIVAVIDEKVVGNVYLIDDVLPFIFRLAVKKEYRNHGIGKSLISEAIDRLKKHGNSEIAFFVDENNEELKEWYRKQGFKEAGVWRAMWKDI